MKPYYSEEMLAMLELPTPEPGSLTDEQALSLIIAQQQDTHLLLLFFLIIIAIVLILSFIRVRP